MASEYKGENALYSFLGSLNYNFDNKYFLQGTIRADGSSNFAEDKRWGYFPSISGSWKISNEKFMEGTREYVDNIKFRIGYGETGNQNISGGLYGSNIQTIKSALGNFFTAGNIANPDLTWQKQKTATWVLILVYLNQNCLLLLMCTENNLQDFYLYCLCQVMLQV